MTALSTPALAAAIAAVDQEIAGIAVRRPLPTRARRAVGPFVFLDQIGPTDLAPGAGLDVPPHPHIGLATVTYLYDGALRHRDSLGTDRVLEPGGVNWMTAGRGIVHSERTPPERRQRGGRFFGLQAWVALPAALAECDPSFAHHGADDLPGFTLGAAEGRLIAGVGFGRKSPVITPSELIQADLRLPRGGTFPLPPEPEERALYIVAGGLSLADDSWPAGTLLVFTPGEVAEPRATADSRLLLLGGAPLDGPRRLWWNFVAADKQRIERAKSDWRDGRFPPVPNDDGFVPLPDGP